MFKNQINPLRLFGSLMLCISIFLIIISVEIYKGVRANSSEDQLIMVAFSLFSLCCFSFSIVLIMGMQWARHVFSLLFTFLIFLWTGILIFSYPEFNRMHLALFGLSIAIYGSLLFCILFLNNVFLLQHSGVNDSTIEEREDILDY